MLRRRAARPRTDVERPSRSPPSRHLSRLARGIARTSSWSRRGQARTYRQDAALAWLLKKPDVPPESREGAWWATLQHRIVSRRRRRFCEEGHEPAVQAHLASLHSRVPSAETQLERERAKAWCIGQVDPSRRDVAERNLLRDETLETIAEHQRKSIGTVRSQLARAKEDLQAAAARLPEQDRRALHHVLAAAAAVLLALWARFARRVRGQGRPLLACAACAAMALALALAGESASKDPAPPAFEEQGAAAFRVESGVVPYLPVWAERELEWGGMAASSSFSTRGAGPVATPRPAAPATSLVPATSSTVPRDLLSRAQAALDAGDVKTARAARELYVETYGHDPYPAQHQNIAAETGSP